MAWVKNKSVKLGKTEQKRIMQLYAENMPVRDIAAELGLVHQTVYRYLHLLGVSPGRGHGDTWRSRMTAHPTTKLQYTPPIPMVSSEDNIAPRGIEMVPEVSTEGTRHFELSQSNHIRPGHDGMMPTPEEDEENERIGYLYGAVQDYLAATEYFHRLKQGPKAGQTKYDLTFAAAIMYAGTMHHLVKDFLDKRIELGPFRREWLAMQEKEQR